MDIKLQLSNDLKNFVNQAVEAGNFASSSACIEFLLAQEKRKQAAIETLALEGLESGECIIWSDELKERLQQEVAERFART